jgi:hypothetical protein
LKKERKKEVSLQLSVEIHMRGIGVGSPEKLAAAHLNYDQTPDTLTKAELGAIADDPPSGDPLRKIPEGSLPRPPVTERYRKR